MLKETLVFMAILTELFAVETTRDFISKYNKYNTVCQGMGYERRSCKGGERGRFQSIYHIYTEQKYKRTTKCFMKFIIYVIF